MKCVALVVVLILGTVSTKEHKMASHYDPDVDLTTVSPNNISKVQRSSGKIRKGE
jgi:hypothetical protein